MDALDRLPLAFRFSSRWIPMSHESAARRIGMRRKLWMVKRRGLLGPDGYAVQMAEDAEAAAAERSSGEVRFGHFTPLVLLMEPDTDAAILTRSKKATMCNVTSASIVAAALLACGSSATAQDASRFAVEVRGGNGIPTGEWTEDGDIENGSGVGLNAQYQVAPFTSVYAGWERYSFDVAQAGDPDFVGVSGPTTDSEARFGIQVTLPLSVVASPFALGGLTYSRVETGTSDLKSAGALGYEAGAGVAVPIIPPLSLTPGVRYRSHRAKFQRSVLIEEAVETTISYWSWEIGLKLGI